MYKHKRIMRIPVKSILLLIGLLTAPFASFQALAECVNPNVKVAKPDSIYIDNGDGTVTDIETGLMWQKCKLGLSGNDCSIGSAQTYTWQAALFVANINTDYGYSDWRLPNIKELVSLLDNACVSSALVNPTFFPNASGIAWSSTPDVSNSVAIWTGLEASGYGLKSDALSVWLVRN